MTNTIAKPLRVAADTYMQWAGGKRRPRLAFALFKATSRYGPRQTYLQSVKILAGMLPDLKR